MTSSTDPMTPPFLNPSRATSRPVRDQRFKVSIFGAAPDTANLGVTALLLSTIDSVLRVAPHSQFTVFDHGRGVRERVLCVGDRDVTVRSIGANQSRHYYRRDSLWHMLLSARLGGAGNPGVKAIQDSDLVLDISGGDSFSDIYGQKRFDQISNVKKLVLRVGTPLILMPQTYGPYSETKNLEVAQQLVRGASMAWARDPDSFEVLKTLLGSDFCEDKHRSGVDLAFALPRRRPSKVSMCSPDWLTDERATPVLGFNVSGLVFLGGEQASQKFGFRFDYRDLVVGFLERVIAESAARVLLVPHVLASLDHFESDPKACLEVMSQLRAGDRVRVVQAEYSASEMKWLIGQTDMFVGTRMHSTIAALSSGVPTAAIAYSQKTRGVFETCGQGDRVADPRNADLEDCLDLLWQAWLDREAMRKSLRQHALGVSAIAQEQVASIIRSVAGGAADGRS